MRPKKKGIPGILVQMWCNDCGHGWGVPAPTSCPQCRSRNTVATGRYAPPDRTVGIAIAVLAVLGGIAMTAFLLYDKFYDRGTGTWTIRK